MTTRSLNDLRHRCDPKSFRHLDFGFLGMSVIETPLEKFAPAAFYGRIDPTLKDKYRQRLRG
jgi:hypothetical protein